MAKIIFGCGYLGLEIARRWLAAGDDVFAVTRSASRAKELARQGLHPIVGDLAESMTLPDISSLRTALFAVGFDRSSGKSIREVYVDGLRKALEILPPTTDTFVYISSTGVYGQLDGQWVDEASPCEPQRAGGRACLDTEQVLVNGPWGGRRIVLRLAGIYGPGRVPRLETVRSGMPLDVDPNGTLNLIHRDDAVETVLAVERHADCSPLFTVSDGNPVRRGDFYATLAQFLDAPPPQFVATEADSTNRTRDRSSKRVSNQRMMRELAVELRYPTYREGLRSIAGG